MGSCTNDPCSFKHSIDSVNISVNSTPVIPTIPTGDLFPLLPSSSSTTTLIPKTSKPIYEIPIQIKGKGKKKKQVLDIWSSAPYVPPTTIEYSSAILKPASELETVTNLNTPKQRLAPITVKDLQWLSTGMTNSAIYNRHRNEAIKLAHARNELFNRARDAFLQNRKHIAKDLSAKAHELNERMHEIHREASESIFATRNSSLRDDDTKIVDLHGLHPDEAIKMLSRKLQEFKRERFSGKVYAIAGTGHHSTRGRNRLLPALLDAFESDYRVREGKMEGTGQSGILIIYFD